MDEMKVMTRDTDDKILVQIERITKSNQVQALNKCLEKFYELRPGVTETLVRIKLHDDNKDGPLDPSFVMVIG